ncbi:polysaccharide pyruvyl transferase family protein [Carboxylicivirga sp. RSCT41]|uniref:polysaccharide pyruvyl transferase family protein n=1 Tax=Carboxylicivirga agarovorans TaxID=3417570 RepID=UPI003D3250D6
MKNALLTYQEGKFTYNLGDYVQSLAARQFHADSPFLINREKLNQYDGDKVKLIMNGWFTHNLRNWIPSQDIDPLFVSFHLNSSAAPFLLDDNSVSYLKEHAPIGCRDKFTVELLKEKGVDAYFTGCLTLTLDNYAVPDTERGDDIYIVEPFFNYPTFKTVTTEPKQFLRSVLNGDVFKIFKKRRFIKKIIDKDLLKTAKFRRHVLPNIGESDIEKFELAETYLKEYAKAKLVITSRIHCALPCLAMGTPVIFIHSFNSEVDTCRFEGIIDLFNRIDVDEKGNTKNNFNLNGLINKDTSVKNKNLHLNMAAELKKKCELFMN